MDTGGSVILFYVVDNFYNSALKHSKIQYQQAYHRYRHYHYQPHYQLMRISKNTC